VTFPEARRAAGRSVRGWLYREGMVGQLPAGGSGPSAAASFAAAGDTPLVAGLDVVVVDVETTGFRPATATIIEIGAVRLSGRRVTGEFFSLVSPGPGVAVPEGITELTGITDDMVGGAPRAADALAAFLTFARGAVLVAHNAPFDMGFLLSGCRAGGLAWPPTAVLDTAVLARTVLREEQVPDCKLATLAAYFGTRTAPCHRALADAQATGEVLLGLLDLVAAARSGRGPGQGHGQGPRPVAALPAPRPLAAICA
jgi:DNA polymerase III epsilon subunit family exonuclease